MPLEKDVDDILTPLLASFDEKIETEISGQLTEVYLSGQAEVITWGKTKGGIPIAYEGPPIQGAIDWAKQHGATLVKGLDEETKKRLAYTISQGIENKRGIPGLSKDIRKTFGDMSKHRSELIARTETANALSQSSLDTMKDMGIGGKQWITAGDADVSDECLANEDEGVIPRDQAFSGGVDAPPQHPDCRCVVSPARLKGEPSPSEAERNYQESISTFTDAHGKDEFEFMEFLGANGKSVSGISKGLRKAGHTEYSMSQRIAMREGKLHTIVHNHPASNPGPVWWGDIRAANFAGAKRVVAVTERNISSLEAPATGWGNLTKAKRIWYKTFRERTSLSNIDLGDEAARNMADTMGYIYKNIPRTRGGIKW